GCTPVSSGRGCTLVSSGRGGTPVSSGRGCTLVSRSVFSFIMAAMFLCVLNRCLYETGYADFCADFDFRGGDFRVIIFLADLTGLFYLKKSATRGSVVIKHIKRILASVKTTLTGHRLIGLVLLSNFVL